MGTLGSPGLGSLSRSLCLDPHSVPPSPEWPGTSGRCQLQNPSGGPTAFRSPLGAVLIPLAPWSPGGLTVSAQEGPGKPQADGEGASSLEKETLMRSSLLSPLVSWAGFRSSPKARALGCHQPRGPLGHPLLPPLSPGGHTRQNGCTELSPRTPSSCPRTPSGERARRGEQNFCSTLGPWDMAQGLRWGGLVAKGHVGVGCCRCHSLHARRGWWTSQEGTHCPQAGPASLPGGTDTAASRGSHAASLGGGPSGPARVCAGQAQSRHSPKCLLEADRFPCGRGGKACSDRDQSWRLER